MAKIEFGYNDKLSFLAEWLDHEVSYQKRFTLNFYPCDGTVELFDRDLNRTYLRRTKLDVSLKELFTGGTVRVYGRQIKITDYADQRTRKFVGKTKEHTVAVVKPNLVAKLGEIVAEIEKRGFQICNARMCRLTRKEVLDLYEPMKGDGTLAPVLEHLVSDPIVALELVGESAVDKWLEALGPADPSEARKLAPGSLRAVYGGDGEITNGLDGSRDAANAIREAAFFFPKDKPRPGSGADVSGQNTTCCVVKPHAVLEGKLGYIISAISEVRFRIAALEMFRLSAANADDFLEVYKGVVTDYHALVLSFVDGPCVALEIAGDGDDVHGDFRRFCGPSDSDIARQIRPCTLRARFGRDKYKNAVHCTDLKEDARLEVEFFFKILKE
ncbi:nucleoside diphosphate kinase 7 [Cylas formicarius]|uniref:nucleoside diphosphate kinase 7 n=1 Tax=Cylas formicarius TaxID=197179 RepID=UPI002958C038|nr:nucleoside diphosphate kinase 7 [Cylas formicarius]XP_060522394.1 nucleoside diphosphate kinase 7 [Cylas formicarius]XP_060522395.1 nucleoside diphosphate kinase 7 [Cylas formicarius]